jgi:outer membrane murein-binding lipoprotein Lpp
MASTALAIIAIVIAVAAVVAVLFMTGAFDTEKDLEIKTNQGDLKADVDPSAYSTPQLEQQQIANINNA